MRWPLPSKKKSKGRSEKHVLGVPAVVRLLVSRWSRNWLAAL